MYADKDRLLRYLLIKMKAYVRYSIATEEQLLLLEKIVKKWSVCYELSNQKKH